MARPGPTQLLLGQVHGAWAALPHLRERGGAFVSVTSMGARRSVPLQSAYCSAKHDIDGFLETLRMGVRRERLPVSITNVLPATINTPLFDQSRSKIGVKPTAPPPVYPPDVSWTCSSTWLRIRAATSWWAGPPRR